MAKKKGRDQDKPAQKPKSLRKQLRKAEADLAKATTKRDKAQARVDAMSIIADELRAQLSDRDKAAATADGSSSGGPTATDEGRAAGRGDRAGGDSGGKVTGRASTARADGPDKRAAGARKAASASSRSATAARTATRQLRPTERRLKPATEG